MRNWNRECLLGVYPKSNGRLRTGTCVDVGGGLGGCSSVVGYWLMTSIGCYREVDCLLDDCVEGDAGIIWVQFWFPCKG